MGRKPLIVLVLAVVLVAIGGCSIAGGTLGGRETCWAESDPRMASLWWGILEIDAAGARLRTPEGDVVPLLPGGLMSRMGADATGELVAGDRVVARAGDDVTLFGGAGSDGVLVVCAVEERHSAADPGGPRTLRA